VLLRLRGDKGNGILRRRTLPSLVLSVSDAYLFRSNRALIVPPNPPTTERRSTAGPLVHAVVDSSESSAC
jgi:hypothetical protein